MARAAKSIAGAIRGGGEGDTSRRLPPMNAVRVFEAAARKGGFTAAARELHISQAAISRHVAHLEATLGVKLFHRSHRHVRLTRDGEIYAAAVAASFDSLEQATRLLQLDNTPLIIRISSLPTFTARWLAPRVGAFHRLHPNIEVHISSTKEPAVFDRNDVNLAIETGGARRKDLRFDELFRSEVTPICNLARLRGPPINKPQDLLAHVLLHVDGLNRDWASWLQLAGVKNPQVAGGLHFSSSTLAYQSAINGAGIVLGQPQFLEEELAGGLLVAPFRQTLPTGKKYHLVSRKAERDQGVILLRDWILAEVQKNLGTRDEYLSLA